MTPHPLPEVIPSDKNAGDYGDDSYTLWLLMMVINHWLNIHI
jgi:hypothetical protein